VVLKCTLITEAWLYAAALAQTRMVMCWPCSKWLLRPSTHLEFAANKAEAEPLMMPDVLHYKLLDVLWLHGATPRRTLNCGGDTLSRRTCARAPSKSLFIDSERSATSLSLQIDVRPDRNLIAAAYNTCVSLPWSRPDPVMLRRRDEHRMARAPDHSQA
jgi:hypothetical protein